ncbi:ROK family protein [Glycomyces harbinensis]|uniref:Sugar kinase of the NBD/HSP70 family, may contain an N-terminal HTH domain n=1 Tax=Glycomyces harbinensis TaxID=58114 RepID=A0A1G6R2A4_9ACTN|nr:ROK family transcriptional regulator [Glycomyces harbinensis]SDC98759.1 Sugar kinase of the NBD/HSP70 family, may contain an N-terminal HTH domain [Glycomyces harbinensis]
MAVTRRTSRDIRSESRLDVLHALLLAGEASRGDLVGVTGLSNATVATVVSDLIEGGLVIEARRTGGRVGRPTTSLRLNGNRGRIVGVDVAETYIRATVFDAALDELASAEVAADEHDDDADYVVDRIVSALDAAIGQAGVARADVLGVGISLPGGMAGWGGVSAVVPDATWPHVDRLRERIDLPIVIDNPLKAIATAELWFGEGRRHASMITINLGTGVGAGIVLEGTILRGATNFAGEWGHSLLALDGRQCRCGRKGCVEAYVGASGIQQTLAGIAPAHPLAAETTQREFIGALAAALEPPSPDPAVSETMDLTARYLGSAIADLVAIVNPEMITLTGWTAWALGGHLVPAVRRRVIEESPGDAAAGLAIEVSTVRGNSVATGIATIALERFLSDVGLVTTRLPTAL